MEFLDVWRQLPAWIRIPVALAIIAFAAFLFSIPPTAGWGRRGAGVGLVMAVGVILLFTGPTDVQRHGYHD